MSTRSTHGLVLRAGLKGGSRRSGALAKAKRQLEDGMQINIVDELELYRKRDLLDFLHIPNGMRSFRRNVAKMKRMGMRPGACDLLIWWGVREFGWIELKTTDGTMRETQEDFAEAVAKFGHRHAVCRSANEVFATLHSWGCPVQP
jgi:hypothetical protein